jgi:hypothetical protein
MNSAQKVTTKIYLVFAMAVFSFAATGKLLSDFSDHRLKNHDPFFTFLSNWQLMVIAATVEIIVVIILAHMYVKDPPKGIPIVLWLCSLFAVYRFGFQISPDRADMCKCFGIGSVLGTIEPKSDGLGIVLLLIMFFGGGTLIVWSKFSTYNRNKKRIQSVATKATLPLIAIVLLDCNIIQAEDLYRPIYIAEGVISQALFDMDGRAIRTNEAQFTISFDKDGRWQITLQSYLTKWAITSTEHISYNGTDVFSVIYSDKRIDRQKKPVSNLPLEANRHPARICPGPFPIDNGQRVGLLWLAFLGGEYVVAPHAMKMPPNLLAPLPRRDPGAWVADFQYKLLNESLSPLIASGSFVLDKIKVSSDLIDYPEIDEPTDVDQMESVNQSIKRLKAANNDDLIRSSYSLLESRPYTNDISIPMHFTATSFSPIGTSSGHIPSVRWDGLVTNIIIDTPSMQILPPIIGKIDVEDRRFLQRTATHFLNGVFYPLDSNGWLVSTSNPAFQEKNILKGFEERHSQKLQKTGYVFTLILFGTIFLFPACILASKAWKRRVAQNNLQS